MSYEITRGIKFVVESDQKVARGEMNVYLELMKVARDEINIYLMKVDRSPQRREPIAFCSMHPSI